MGVYDQAHALANSIRESDEYREAARLKEIALQDDTNRALLTEYSRLQTKLQLTAIGGTGADSEEMRRFQQLASLLYMNRDAQAFLLAEMRLQKMLGDIMKIVGEAAGLRLDELLG